MSVAHQISSKVTRRHAPSAQKVARAQTKFVFHYIIEHSTRTIPAEGRSRSNAIDISPYVWAFDTRDPRRGSPMHKPNLHFTTRLSTRYARSPPRVAPNQPRSTFHHTFERSTRTILAEDYVSWAPAGPAASLKNRTKFEKKSNRSVRKIFGDEI